MNENSVDEEMPSSLREMMRSGSQLDFFTEDNAKARNTSKNFDREDDKHFQPYGGNSFK